MGNEENKKANEQIGMLGGCLIEGDSEQKARERKARRRALTISIGLQSAALVALLVTPLLAKPEKLAFTLYTPIPQYYHSTPERHDVARPPAPTNHQECIVCFNQHLSPRAPTQTTARQSEVPVGIDIDPVGDSTSHSDGLNIFDKRTQPAAPEDPEKNKKRRISVGGTVQQAMLIRRVEPGYPPLARQLRRAGQVHLRALISTDGRIESLQAMDGDPLLIQSALDAVGQWRYKPTTLNGSAVEVETVITVIYTLNQ